MKITVNAVHFNADSSLVDFIQKKLNKLETFYDKITNGEVYLRLEKGEKSSIHKKLVEIKLNVPGSTLFIKEEGDSFEEATDKALDVVTRKIKRFKQKQNDISHDKPVLEMQTVDDEI